MFYNCPGQQEVQGPLLGPGDDSGRGGGGTEWPRTDPRKTAAREFARNHPAWEDWKPFYETRPPETLCNLQIVLIQQTKYLLDRMIRRHEEDFKQHGGIRERMHAARTAARGSTWPAALRDWLSAAETPEDLTRRLDDARRQIDRVAWSVRNQKGWQA